MSASPVSADSSGPTLARRLAVVATLIWMPLIALCFLFLPGDLMPLVVAATYLVLSLVITAAPLARGARPVWMWAPQALGGVGFISSLFLRFNGGTLGPLQYYDLANFVGYGLFILSLVLLCRHASDGKDHSALVDAGAVTVGVTLALWSGAIGPLVGRPELPSAIVWAAYPTIDVLILMLCLYIVMRRGDLPPTMAWLLPSITLQLVVDCSSALNSIFEVGVGSRVFIAGSLLSYSGIALAVSHPSIVVFSRPPTRDDRHPAVNPGSALLILAMSPAILATAVPISGTVDAVVRSTLVAVLLAILFVRLWSTMSALKRAESDSRHRATHDALTGLHNRASLLSTLTRRLERDFQRGHRTAVLFLDCDGFKAVNDTWGHEAGDAVLLEIATRLPASLREDDVLARHGGDEFVVLATVDSAADAMALAERVRASFLDLSPDEDGRPLVTPSIGVTVSDPTRGSTTQEMLNRADAAMYAAKRAGRSRCVLYDAHLEDDERSQNAVGCRLATAIRSGAIGVRLLPVVAVDQDVVVGWEAVPAWHDLELGDVPLAVFLTVAERLGLAADLGELVLRRACTELAALRSDLGREDLHVAVGICPGQLSRPDLPATVRTLMAEAGLPPGSLWLAITGTVLDETLAQDDEPAALTALTALRAAGASICLDDVGGGRADLAALLRLPVDGVGIDASLTARLDTSPEAAKQFVVVLELVRGLGIEAVVAGGLTEPRQAALLASLGCPYVHAPWFTPATSDEPALPRGATTSA